MEDVDQSSVYLLKDGMFMMYVKDEVDYCLQTNTF